MTLIKKLDNSRRLAKAAAVSLGLGIGSIVLPLTYVYNTAPKMPVEMQIVSDQFYGRRERFDNVVAKLGQNNNYAIQLLNEMDSLNNAWHNHPQAQEYKNKSKDYQKSPGFIAAASTYVFGTVIFGGLALNFFLDYLRKRKEERK
jgi:hypothetical protein